MKKSVRTLLIILLMAAPIILLSFVFISTGSNRQKAKATTKGFAVVELFTSEGCSSCPPADAAIAELLSKGIKDVYILSYHVDYWNYLGWKDEFSQPGFSARQRQYAKHLSVEGVYTPQVIVNGTVEFVGSNQNKLNSAVSNGINSGSASNLHITAQKKNNSVVVRYQITGGETVLLNTALVLPEAVTKIKRGENGGRTLRHVNIISDLRVMEVKGSGVLSIDIPQQLTGRPLKIIAYTQAKKSFKVMGADGIDL